MNRINFDDAYAGWKESPRPVGDGVSSLWDMTQRIRHNDETIGDVLAAYHQTKAPASPPVPGWNDAMSWVLQRDVQTLRRRLQSGHHQVATRVLLDHSLALKRAWDAYRSAVETE
jgi:hypothetical protein